jgi:hypothetical protein
VRYLVSEVLLRLIKPLIALLLGLVLYWLITGPIGEPGSALLALACWISAGVLIQLLETGII